MYVKNPFEYDFFDDVLIGASLSLPRQILDRLQPWDLHNLVPYDENYISGFQSELYQYILLEHTLLANVRWCILNLMEKAQS